MSILSLHRPMTANEVARDADEVIAAGWIGRCRRALARWFARSAQRRALREIAERNDFHLLKDIGVSQEQAFREVCKPFWRE